MRNDLLDQAQVASALPRSATTRERFPFRRESRIIVRL
jgi:hypothetical protein